MYFYHDPTSQLQRSYHSVWEKKIRQEIIRERERDGEEREREREREVGGEREGEREREREREKERRQKAQLLKTRSGYS